MQSRIKSLQETTNPSLALPTPPTDEKLAKLKSESKTIKDKLSSATRKLEDERMANVSLKKELGNLYKVLAQEVGDGYNLEKVYSSVIIKLTLSSCSRVNRMQKAELSKFQS